ncbi:hypothetical protein [Paenibacillus sinopodophylli]|uniref:hypothetical protein n=1 Tax=Paenibacillus sinopodophylli TaxID=1837342 RepID=UPI001FE50A40|nr:hypothetical protein [Paenibacillus sinopodophylli]
MAENMTNMGNIGNMGNTGNLPNLGGAGSMPNMNNMPNMHNMHNVGGAGSMPNTGNMSHVGSMGSMPNMPNTGGVGNMVNMGHMPSTGGAGSMPNMGHMGSMGAMENTSPVLYQAEPKHTEMVMQVRDRVMGMCGGHMHKYVRVQTIDGHIYEGMLMHMDHCILYLQCTMRDPRAFMNPYNAVLPLVLYELLVITLLNN